MGYNTKNYAEQGGDRLVIGGELAVTDEGRISVLGSPLKPAAGQEDTTDAPATIRDAFNALLAKLQAAGLMERAILTLTDAGSNTIESSTTYTNVSGETDAWVVDVIIVFSEPIPAGTEIEVAELGGTPYEVPAETHTIWLSDIMHGQNPEASRRERLNQHTTTDINVTVGGLTDELVTDVSLKIVTADGPGLEGTHQSAQDFGTYVVLTQGALTDVTLAAESA